MIADVLADAHASLQDYLTNPTIADCYSAPMLARIVAICRDMNTIRTELDSQLPDDLQPDDLQPDDA